MAEHTPTPWELIPSTENHGPYVVANYGGSICDFYAMSNPLSAAVCNGGNSKPIHHMGGAADANAAFAVRAVNAHDDLVAALKKARPFVIDASYLRNCVGEQRAALDRVLSSIGEAIAKAEGRS